MSPLVFQLISLFIFIVFVSAVNLQSRAKAILTGVFAIVTAVIFLGIDNGVITPYLKNTFEDVLIVSLPPLLAVAAAYGVLVRYTLAHNRSRKRK